MEEFRREIDLYRRLIPAFKVKLRLLAYEKYDYITKEDIWNYLKKTKWEQSYGLSLNDMTNDIITVSPLKIENYIRGYYKEGDK